MIMEERAAMSTPTTASRSAELYERALKVLPGGVSRNTILRDPHPVYVASARGCRVTDIDGVTRIDFANNMASLVHGHSCPEIVAAVTEQLVCGTAFTLGTEVEVRYAEHMCSRTPGFDRVRFVNSGTEAVMVALKAARAFTGRPKIAKCEGAYHGLYDYVEVSQDSGPDNWGPIDRPNSVPLVHGTPPGAIDATVVIPFNDTARTLKLLDEHRDSLACVLLDLMPHRAGLVPASAEYIREVRAWTQRHGVLLALDEVITYRSEYGGLQTRYGVTPDLTAMGKMIGGGFPIGGVAGRADVMDVLNPRAKKLLFPHAGTFSGNPISLTAGLIAMEKFDRAAITRLNGLADRARRGIDHAIRETGIAACLTGAGSMFRVHMKSAAPTNHRESYPNPAEAKRMKMLLADLFDRGFVLINSGSSVLSTPMGEAEIDGLIDAMHAAFERIAKTA